MIQTIQIYSIDSIREHSRHFSLFEVIGSDYLKVIPDLVIERDYIDAGGTGDHMSYASFTFWQRDDTINYIVDLNGFNNRTTPPAEIAVHFAVHVCNMCDMFPDATLKYTHVFTEFDEENSPRTRNFMKEISRVLEVPVVKKFQSEWREDDTFDKIVENINIISSNTLSASRPKSYDMDPLRFDLEEILRELESDYSLYLSYDDEYFDVMDDGVDE